MTVIFDIFKSAWTPRTTALETEEDSAEKKSSKHGTVDEWIYTRGIILRVVGRFPEAMAAVREALAAARRTTPKELYEPG